MRCGRICTDARHCVLPTGLHLARESVPRWPAASFQFVLECGMWQTRVCLFVQGLRPRAARTQTNADEDVSKQAWPDQLGPRGAEICTRKKREQSCRGTLMRQTFSERTHSSSLGVRGPDLFRSGQSVR